MKYDPINKTLYTDKGELLKLQDDFDLEEGKAAMEYLLKSIPKAIYS